MNIVNSTYFSFVEASFSLDASVASRKGKSCVGGGLRRLGRAAFMNDVKSNESLIFDLRVKIIAQTFLSRAEGRADTLCCEGDGEDGRLSEEAERHDSGDNHGHSLH